MFSSKSNVLSLWSLGMVTIRDATNVPTGSDPHAFSRDNWKVITDWYMEQVTNLREQELDVTMDQAQNHAKVRWNLPVLVRPPEEREDGIPEGLHSDSPPPIPVAAGSAAPVRTKQVRDPPARFPDIPRGSRRRPREKEEDGDEWVPSRRPRRLA